MIAPYVMPLINIPFDLALLCITQIFSAIVIGELIMFKAVIFVDS